MFKAKLTYAGRLITAFIVLLIGISLVIFRYLHENPVGRGVRFVVEGRLPEGYVWEHTQGPDFDIYHARALGSQEAGIGVYLGHHPDFPYQADHLLCDEVRILGVSSCWVIEEESGVKPTFYRTTLLEYQYGIYAPIYIHIWVYADREEDLQSLLASLKYLRVKPAINMWELFMHRKR